MKYNAYRDLSIEVGQNVIMVDDLKNNKMKRVEAKIVKKKLLPVTFNVGKN